MLTILLDSELVEVFADPNERKTVKAAAKCLNASVSAGPPPATANSCRNRSIEQRVLPAPDDPALWQVNNGHDFIKMQSYLIK